MSYLHGEPAAEDDARDDGSMCRRPCRTRWQVDSGGPAEMQPDASAPPAPAVPPTPAAATTVAVTTATTPAGAVVPVVEVTGDTTHTGPGPVVAQAADAPFTVFGLPPLVAAALGLGLVLILRK